MKPNTIRSILCATAGATALCGTLGCATKGFVREQVGELRTTVSSENDTMRQNVSDAQRKADAAAFGFERARHMALGNVDFKTIEDHTIHFSFDSSALESDAVAELERAVATLRARPELLAEIYGHADTTGPVDYNEELSRRRALAVHRFLAERAEGPLWRFALVGFGESFPVTGSDEEDTAASRRVVVRIVERSEPASERQRDGV